MLAPDGTPAAGETVTITDTRTGSSRSVTTNDSGAFNVRGLPVGGDLEYTDEITLGRAMEGRQEL